MEGAGASWQTGRMESPAEKMELLGRHVARMVAAVEGDAGASPVLRAVVLEFQRKLEKNRATLTGADGSREAVVELEQAADSARVAAEADPGASADTKKLVDVAHMAICMFKFEQGPART